jgi:hypothetical protein
MNSPKPPRKTYEAKLKKLWKKQPEIFRRTGNQKPQKQLILRNKP